MAYKRSVKIGLSSDGMFVGDGMFVAYRRYLLLKDPTFLFWKSCVTQLMINCSKLSEVASNYPNFKELFPYG